MSACWIFWENSRLTSFRPLDLSHTACGIVWVIFPTLSHIGCGLFFRNIPLDNHTQVWDSAEQDWVFFQDVYGVVEGALEFWVEAVVNYDLDSPEP